MKVCYRCRKSVDEDQMASGLHPACFCSWFQVDAPIPFGDVVARSADVGGESDRWRRITSSFFHGKFRKYSARVGENAYILKVQQEGVPELPATEYLCNQIASHLGLEVPDFYLVRFENELDSFVSKNFMVNRPASDLVHIYRYLENPDHYDCEHLLRIIDKQVGRYDAVVRFIRLCLFDSLVGNDDRHGRNLALIQEAEKVVLSPFYDNPCYLAQEIPSLLGAHHEPRGAIGTSVTHEPVMVDYVEEWNRLGFKDEVLEFAESIDLEKIQNLINFSFISEKRKGAIWKLCQRRYKELCNAI